MLLMRAMQKGLRGLAIIFGKAPPKIENSLTEWAVVETDSSPETCAELQNVRRFGGANADTYLLLIGVGPGNDAVRRILASNMCPNIVAILMIDAAPPGPRDAELWRTWEAHADAGKIVIERVNNPGADIAGALKDIHSLLPEIKPSLPETLTPEDKTDTKGEG